MRKAFALLSIAVDERLKGNCLGIVREDPDDHHLHAIGKVVGI